MREYETISNKLEEALELTKTPVAVKLYEYMGDVDKTLEKFEGEERHCGMLKEVAVNKRSFYATENEYSCQNGSVALGLTEGDLKNVPKVDRIIEAVAYAPLEKATFKPDVIVLYVNPVQMMKIAQKLRRNAGKRTVGDFSGVQSLCADVVSKPFLTNESNMSVGCGGSRGFKNIDPDELVVGLTLSDAESIVN